MQKERKQDILQKRFVQYWLGLQKKIDPKKLGRKGSRISGRVQKICKAEAILFHSAMSETKAAFTERTIWSLKTILYRYMEDYGYKYIHKLSQFATNLNFRQNFSIDLIPKNVKKSDLISFLYSKPLQDYPKTKVGIGDRVRFSQYDLHFRKGYKPESTRVFFELVAISSQKPPTYKMNDEQDEIIRCKFLAKRVDQSLLTMGSLTIELVSNVSDQLLPDNTLSSLTNFIPE